MGIKDLLPLLDPIANEMHIRDYAGKTVAVDGHSWLYCGAFDCAFELAINMTTANYVNYFMEMVQMLLFFNVTPLIIFDGMHLPMKAYTNEKRSDGRQGALDRGRYYLRNGLSHKATKSFQKAVVITEDMIYEVIAELKKINVKYIIAPYEANPQLTYLVNKGIAVAAITEDSDLLPYGCKKVIYKMDRSGSGVQIAYDDIFKEEQLRMTEFTPQMFRYMCILSGYDYLPSLSALFNTVEKARGMLQRYPTVERFINALYVFCHKHLVDSYLNNFFKADASFLYQYVYDMNSCTYTRLNPVPSHVNPEDISLLGKDPNNKYILLLRANPSIIRPSAAYLKSIKENTNPLFADDNDDNSDDEFGELKFNNTTSKQLEDILERVDHTTANTTTVKNNKATMTNSIPSTSSATVAAQVANATKQNHIPFAAIPSTGTRNTNVSMTHPISSSLDATAWYTASLRRARADMYKDIFSNHTGRKPEASFKVYVDKTEPVRKRKHTTLGDRSNNVTPPKKSKPTSTRPPTFNDLASSFRARFGRLPRGIMPMLSPPISKSYTSLAGKSIDDKKIPTKRTITVIDDDDDDNATRSTKRTKFTLLR